jgi:hypothetical protein
MSPARSLEVAVTEHQPAPTPPTAGAGAAGEAAYWRAVARLPVDRAGALAELEAVFAAGSAPGRLDGRYRGRYVTATVRRGVDPALDGLARLWLPWKGKVFDAASAGGRNLFTAAGGAAVRLWFRNHRTEQDAHGNVLAFPFRTATGTSVLVPGLAVLKLDYDLPDNPDRPVRKVLDELVQVGEGLYLGQALVRRGGRFERAAWFSFEPPAARP